MSACGRLKGSDSETSCGEKDGMVLELNAARK